MLLFLFNFSLLIPLTPCSCCKKANLFTIYKNQYFIARNSNAETLLLEDSIIKGVNTYKGTWYKYFPNSFNFGISGDCAEKVPWRALKLLEMSYLKTFCINSLYDIAQCLIDIGVCFRIRLTKGKIFVSRILRRNECYSVNRILIKEINTRLKCKCVLHLFNFIEQKQGWTNNNGVLDSWLFYQDMLHLIQKGNIKLSE